MSVSMTQENLCDWKIIKQGRQKKISDTRKFDNIFLPTDPVKVINLIPGSTNNLVLNFKGLHWGQVV